MYAPNSLLARLRTLWPYAVAVLLPGGSIIALGMWLYSRRRSGKPLLPFSFRRPASLKI
jgi:hypothetical protein